MQKSNLVLETYFIERLNWSVVEGFDAQKSVYELVLPCDDIECDIERVEFETQRRAAYRLTLKYAARPDKYPYEWLIALIGYFHLEEGIPDAQVESFMNAGGPAVLYGAAREALVTTLSRGPFPVSTLPSVHFANIQFESPTPVPPPKKRRKKLEAPAKS